MFVIFVCLHENCLNKIGECRGTKNYDISYETPMFGLIGANFVSFTFIQFLGTSRLIGYNFAPFGSLSSLWNLMEYDLIWRPVKLLFGAITMKKNSLCFSRASHSRLTIRDRAVESWFRRFRCHWAATIPRGH